MNLDSDIECTCDVGFSSPDCPSCSRRSFSEHSTNRPVEKPKLSGPSITDLALHYAKLNKEYPNG